MFLPTFVCLSVSKITRKTRAWIWMKCCVSTDVGTWTNWLILSPIRIIVWKPEPDCFLRYRMRCYAEFSLGKSDVYVLAAAARRCFNMVLFTEPVSCHKQDSLMLALRRPSAWYTNVAAERDNRTRRSTLVIDRKAKYWSTMSIFAPVRGSLSEYCHND